MAILPTYIILANNHPSCSKKLAIHNNFLAVIAFLQYFSCNSYENPHVFQENREQYTLSDG